MSGNSLALSSDLNVITAEINSYKQVAGQSLFEIGKRLKHVKEKDLTHGQWESWCREKCKISPQRAWEYITAFEQFGNLLTSGDLSSSQVFEMLSLPETVDRDQFVKESHTVPSTGEVKKVDEMTVRELREVKKARQAAEERATKAENEARHFQALWNQEKNKPTRIVTKEVETVPKDYEQIKLDHQRLNNENVKLHRNNQELVQQLSEAKFTDTSLRKVKEKCVSILRDLTGNHSAMMLELYNVQGHPEAAELIDDYSERLNNFISMVFKDLKELSQVKQTNGGIDVEYTVISD